MEPSPNIKISVILPVYNVEPYLRQCLESIIHQTLQELEIICVNDGSTDGSLDILIEFAAADGRIKIIDQKNAGAGAARNRGLAIAKGEYLSFLDADDFFELNMLEEAYSASKKCDADFVVFRSDDYHNEHKRFEPCAWTVKDTLLPAKKVFCYKDIQNDLFKVFVGWAWDKLYKREFVLETQLQFQEQRSTNDMYFVFSALVLAKKITVLPKVLAHHRRSISDSISVTREKSWQCFYFALTALKELLIQKAIYDEVKQSYVNYALHFCLWNLNTIQGETYEKLYNKLRDEYFDTLGIPDLPEEAFYHTGEYAQYKRIKELPMVVYLLDEIAAYKKGAGKESFDRRSYKIGRAITYIPRIIARFLRGCRKYGLKNAFRQGVKSLGK
jgi:glycosyltransferase involved in cell wall biosynthesis